MTEYVITVLSHFKIVYTKSGDFHFEIDSNVVSYHLSILRRVIVAFVLAAISGITCLFH